MGVSEITRWWYELCGMRGFRVDQPISGIGRTEGTSSEHGDNELR